MATKINLFSYLHNQINMCPDKGTTRMTSTAGTVVGLSKLGIPHAINYSQFGEFNEIGT